MAASLAVAIAREKAGVVHLLGLPRAVVVELHDVFERSPRDPQYPDELRRIFGAMPYTFTDDSAPSLREFGNRVVSAKKRAATIASLRDELRSTITDLQKDYPHPFGVYKDAVGRHYKFEEGECITIKYLVNEDRRSAPQRHSRVTIEHMSIRGYRVHLLLDAEILAGKTRTLLMKYTVIDVDDRRK